jgi:hypothetical protein
MSERRNTFGAWKVEEFFELLIRGDFYSPISPNVSVFEKG